MMKILRKNSLYLLSIYALVILAYSIVHWDSILLLQKIIAILTVIGSCHEWEETRIPGGFFEFMGGMLGVDAEWADTEAMYAKPDLLIFVITALAYFLPQISLFSATVIFLGFYEGVVHIMGIFPGKPEKPYTPGLFTAEIFEITAIVSTVLLHKAGGLGALNWVLGIVWFFFCFMMTEISVWKCMNVNPRDLVGRFNNAGKKNK